MLQLIDKPRDTKAWDRFVELGLPTKENEVYRYVRLKELYNSSFHLPQALAYRHNPENSTLVFVNGAYCESLSHVPKPLVALPLAQAFKVYGNFLTPRIQKQLKEEKDPFAVINGAYCIEGLFLYLPPKSVVQTPLKIIHIVDQIEQPTLLCPRIHLFAGKHAAITLSFSHKTALPNVWINSVIDLALEEGACVSLATLSHQEESSHDFLALRATLKNHSVLKSYGITNGSATSRHDYHVRLQGAGADASLYGVWNLKENRQHHVNVKVEHQEPSCTSLQKFKGILTGASRSSFEGKIYVMPQAQKTEAYQINNNLILSEKAAAYSKPNLEIFADDVKASHGATIGQLNEEQLFYLTTRGVPLDLARSLLVKGFSQDILDLLEDRQIKNEAVRVIA